uniref:hypothetical protein n=1 Tax=Lachnoclostridium phocaeense TaxID=1871021 RepID=UPI0026DB331A|nr:hypothetical protein [Lachnoclostridium phocaeense]
MKIKRKNIIIGILAVILAFAICTVRFYLSYSNERTGEEWFSCQATYMKDCEAFANGMDDVFSLYISGSIAEDDFLVHIKILEEQLEVMEAVYTEDEASHPVRLGTHTYSTKKGCDAVKGCFGVFGDILAMARENSGDIGALSYEYMGYHQVMIDQVSDYTAAVRIVEEESNDK